MALTIDFEGAKTQSIVRWFYGKFTELDVDYAFTIFASWNNLDDWTVDSIEWEESTPSEDDDRVSEIEDIITEEFLSKLIN